MHSVVVDQVDDTLLATMSGLTDGDFYASPGWIRYEGVDPDSTQRFALVFDDHELVAAAPLYVVDHEASRRYSPRTVLLDAPTDRPTLLVGNRRGYASQLAVVDDHRRQDALTSLVATVDTVAGDLADGVAWWMYLREADIRDLGVVTCSAGPWLMAGEAAVALPGATFADYVDMLPRKRRSTVRADRRLFAASGLAVEDHRLDRAWPELAPLVGAHQRRHGHGQDDDSLGRLLCQQAEVAAEQSLVLLCGAPDRVAGSLSFTSPRHVTSRAFGTVLPAEQRIGEYFELAYYRPIEHAYAAGLGELHLGIGTLWPKVLRGARVRLRWTVATGPRAPHRDAAPHNAREFAAIVEELRGDVEAIEQEGRPWLS